MALVTPGWPLLTSLQRNIAVRAVTGGGSLDEDAAFRAVQQSFLPGAVTIVGSGFACSFGMPGMPALATHLLREVPPVVAASTAAAQASWATIADALTRGEGLEAALALAAPNEEIASIVAEKVGDAVADAETDAIRGIIEAGDVPALGRLLLHIAQSNTVVDVITTNYDRIIEYCAGLAGLLIDTMFFAETTWASWIRRPVATRC